MKTQSLTAIALLLLLPVTELVMADQPHGQRLSQESTKIFSKDGSKVLGVLIVGRSKIDGKIRSLFYSGPPELVVRQVDPWTRWHNESELMEVHLALTSVNAELFTYLSEIKSLDTLRIEDCIFETNADAALGKLSMLNCLEIDFARDYVIRDWSFLAKLTELNELSVVGDVVTADFASGFESMASLKNLEFWIDDQTKAGVLPKLTALKNIERIQITRVASKTNQTGQPF